MSETLGPSLEQDENYTQELEQQAETLQKGELKFFISSLLQLESETRNGIETSAFLNMRESKNAHYVAQFDKYVYSLPAVATMIRANNVDYPSLVTNIANLQKVVDSRLKQDGIELICPNAGDNFDSSRHNASENNLVWINDQPELNDKIHSVIQHGYQDASGKLCRPAETRRYVYTEPPEESGDEAADEWDEIRRAANP